MRDVTSLAFLGEDRVNRRPQPEMDPRQANAMMTERIETNPAQPFREGEYALRVLEVPGRMSGRTIKTPIGVTQLDGHLYLISSDQRRAWTLNLGASGTGILSAGGERTSYRATPVEGTVEGARALRRYVSLLPFAASQFPFNVDDDDERIRAASAGLSVFRLDPLP